MGLMRFSIGTAGNVNSNDTNHGWSHIVEGSKGACDRSGLGDEEEIIRERKERRDEGRGGRVALLGEWRRGGRKRGEERDYKWERRKEKRRRKSGGRAEVSGGSKE